MSNFPTLSNEFVKKKFMSDDNLTYVYGQIKTRLCVDKLKDSLLDSINTDIKQIYAKYTDNDIEELNNYVIEFVSERYSPIKKVNEVIDSGILPAVPMPELLSSPPSPPPTPNPNDIRETGMITESSA